MFFAFLALFGSPMQLLLCDEQVPCAGGGTGRPCPLHPRPGTVLGKQLAYAAGGKGGPPPLHPRPVTSAPWNPDSMPPYAECLMRMLTGR